MAHPRSPRSTRAIAFAAILLGGCVAFPAATPGGRARMGVAGAFGDTQGGAVLTPHVGVAPLSLVPEIYDGDFELGYVGDLFIDTDQQGAHGAYVGGAYTPLLGALTSQTYLRATFGLDLDVMTARGIATVGGTASVGFELFGYTTGEGVVGDVRAGVAGIMAGQWGVGVQLQGSYRYLETGQHYGHVGAALSIRFPAAVGGVYATALLALDIAADQEGTSSGDEDWGDISSGEARSQPMRSPDDRAREAAPPPPDPRWFCSDGVGGSSEGATREEARSLCGSVRCVCRERGSEPTGEDQRPQQHP